MAEDANFVGTAYSGDIRKVFHTPENQITRACLVGNDKTVSQI